MSFMTLDWDGKTRMDCSPRAAMASLREAMTPDAQGNTPLRTSRPATTRDSIMASSRPTV